MTDTPSPIWLAVWEAGPDAGAAVALPRGSYVVGRARRAAVRCDDPALQPFHVLIDVHAETATVRQLSGRLPVRLDGQPFDGEAPVRHEGRLEIGHSVLVLRREVVPAPEVADSGRQTVVVRTPRATPRFEPEPVLPPLTSASSEGSTGTVLPSLLALAGAGLLAVLMHQPMFLLFGAVGAIAAFGTWGGQRIGSIRARRRRTRREEADVRRFTAEVARQREAYIGHRRIHDSTAVMAHRALELGDPAAAVWTRRPAHDDAFTVALGIGDHSWGATVASRQESRAELGSFESMSVIPNLAVSADIGPGCRLALHGVVDRTAAVVRSMVLQAAVNCGPADLRLAVVTARPDEWSWVAALPHCRSGNGSRLVIGEGDIVDVLDEDDRFADRHLVVICDEPRWLAARTSPLRRLLARDRPLALIVLLGEDESVPHVCTSVLHVSGPTQARWSADVTGSCVPAHLHWSGMGGAAAARMSSRLAQLVDPEDTDASRSVPADVTLWSLVAMDAVPGQWAAAGVDPSPCTPIGVAADGVVEVDLVRDGPHALVAGTTGAGKSELLRSLIVGLALRCSPDHVVFVLVDYKGGATFDGCARLPHVVGVVTDLDDRLADRALRSLQAELRRREQLLREAGASDLRAYRRITDSNREPMPRLIVIIDEFATLVAEQPDFLHALVGIAQRGRSLGVHLVLATQRPSGVISDDIRANTNLRIALRLNDTGDSADVIGDPAAAALSRATPGRAIMRLGPEEVLVFQAGSSSGDRLSEVVEMIRDAATTAGIEPPRSPWLPPLPDRIPVEVAHLECGVVGIVDDPDQQRTIPLRWAPDGGHLALIGSAGHGATSTLAMLAAAATHVAPRCHVAVIDCRGSSRLAGIAEWAACVAVVRLHERERLIRMMNWLRAELVKRAAATAAPVRPLVVFVNGFDSLRAELDAPDTSAQFETLERLVVAGTPHGMTIVAAFDRAASMPSTFAAHCAERWIFHLADPIDAIAAGVSATDVPSAVPGRIVVASSGLHAQLAFGDVTPSTAPLDEVPPRIECLPRQIAAEAMPTARVVGSSLVLPMGVGFADGQPAALEVPDGEHIVIVGPARSGRTTVLQRVVEAWREIHPDGWFTVVEPRRRRSRGDEMAGVPPSGPVLLAIDDAELLDDERGELAALIGEHRRNCLVVAAGKGASLRHSYGHWTGVVRRSRIGVVLAAATDVDADLLGVQVPRRLPIAARPGLAWLIGGGASGGEPVLAQVATSNRVFPAHLGALEHSA